MLPTVVLVQSKVDLHEGTPLGPLGLANEMHSGFLRRPVCLACVARNAGANNVFPSRWPATVARNHVIEIQVFPLEDCAAVLAKVFIALENIMPCEFDFLLRQAVIENKQDYARHANPKRDRVNAFRMRLLFGKIMPFCEVVGLKRAVVTVEDDFCMALEQKCQCPFCSANVDCLP